MKIILYELNEVPWQVIDAYVKAKPRSCISKILKNSIQLTTHTQDEGELHPWTTWPTFHRGVYNKNHKIEFLNQEIHTPYQPIWEILSAHNISTGVFGSLQTWPLPVNHSYSFYVPDTFAQDAQTYPKFLKAFQKINLRYTNRDAGIFPKALGIFESIYDGINLVKCGLRVKTVFTLMRQIIREIINPNFKSIRSIYQAPIAFDYYLKMLKSTKPAFSTFFTNHLAGMMHRYWKYSFPKEFKYKLKSDLDHFRSNCIPYGLDIADQQLSELKKFADLQGYTILIASSMGQEAIDRGEYVGELRLSHLDQFYKAVGYHNPIQNNMAMNPDFTFKFENENDLQDFKNKVAKLYIGNEKKSPAFTFKQSGLTLNCNLQSSADTIKIGYMLMDETKIPFEGLGITVEQRSAGTGYHQPFGVAIFYQQGLKPNKARTTVESISIMPTLLKMFGIHPKPYMADPVKTVLNAFEFKKA